MRAISEADVNSMTSHDPSGADDCAMKFFRGLAYGVTLGSVFWVIVAALFLID